ncbi:MAG: hypothetical protein AAGA96_19230 [Verrucomicrobiota bacterium]
MVKVLPRTLGGDPMCGGFVDNCGLSRGDISSPTLSVESTPGIFGSDGVVFRRSPFHAKEKC